MQPAALGKAQRWAPSKGAVTGTRRRRGSGSGKGSRRAFAPACAVAVSDDTTDLGALFRDALSTPTVKKTPPATPSPSLPPAPAAAPAAPAVPDAAAPAASVTVDPVPGTEILQSAPAPQPPPEPSQGMDFVLDQLKLKPPGYGGNDTSAPAAAAKAAKAAAAPLTNSVGEGLGSAGKGLEEAGAAASKGLSSAVDSVGDAFGGAGDSVSGALGGAANVLGGAAGALTGAASGAADAAAGASAAAAAAASQAADVLNSTLSGAAGGAVSSAQQFLDAAVAEFNTEASIIKANVDSLVGGLTSAVDGTTSAVSSSVSSQVSGVAQQVSGAVDQLTGLLPPEAQQALAAAGGAVTSAAAKLSVLDPTTGAAVAGLGLGLPALLAWNATYGGYAGVLEPQEAMELLQTQNAVLIDVRPEQQRVERGVAELRRAALGKGAAVPPVQLLPSVSRRLRDPSAVALEMLAFEIAALAKLDPASTRVILMDDKGESTKRLARALRSVGVRRPYVLAGGFRAWQAAGQPVRQGISEYVASPLDTVEDVAGTVAEQAASQLSSLRQPKNAAVAAAALTGLGYFAFNFHTALQFLGVLGLELTLVSRVASYSSLDDAWEDVQGLASGAASLAALPAKAAEALGRSGRGTTAGESKV